MAESNHKNQLPVSKSFWHIFDTTAVTLDVMVTWFFLRSPPHPEFLLLLKCLSSGSPNWWQGEAKVRWDLGQSPGRDNVSSVYAWKLTEQYLTVSFLLYRNVDLSSCHRRKKKKKAIVCCSCYFLFLVSFNLHKILLKSDDLCFNHFQFHCSQQFLYYPFFIFLCVKGFV